MIFVPLLHYLQCKNSLQRQRGRDALPASPRASAPCPTRTAARRPQKEEAILTVDLWPEPWTLDKTDPALRRREVFPLTDEGRAAARKYLNDAYNAEPERWSARPSILDCEPWTPPAGTGCRDTTLRCTMIYRLKELKGDTIPVPQLVFSKLGIAEEYNVRVALYVLATGVTDPEKLCADLKLRSTHDRRERPVLLGRCRAAGAVRGERRAGRRSPQPLPP